MIRSPKDYADYMNLLDIKAFKDKIYNTKIKYQEDFLNSKDFNSTYNIIEERINNLYERIRIMQDITSYLKEFIKFNIYKNIEEIENTAKEIDNKRDSLKQSNYDTINVPLVSVESFNQDRDEKIIKKCSVINKKLTIHYTTIKNVDISSITRTTAPKLRENETPTVLIPYRENLYELLNDKPYRVFYLLDGPVVNGMKEEIVIKLKENSLINTLELVTAKCKIDNVRYIDDNNTVEFDDNFNGFINTNRKIKEIRFILTSDLYDKKIYNIDTTRMSQDFWNRVVDNYYSLDRGETAIYDIDKLSGYENFKKEYEEYLKKYKKWQDDYNNYVNAYEVWKNEAKSIYKPGYTIEGEGINIIAGGSTGLMEVDYETTKDIFGNNSKVNVINSAKDKNLSDILNKDNTFTVGLGGAINGINSDVIRAGDSDRLGTRIRLIDAAQRSGYKNINNTVHILDAVNNIDIIDALKEKFNSYPNLILIVDDANNMDIIEQKNYLNKNPATLVIGSLNFNVGQYGAVAVNGIDKEETKKIVLKEIEDALTLN